ncbi:MAG: benzoate-CoA ligase family protein [Xanthobacteraceae bacterium]
MDHRVNDEVPFDGAAAREIGFVIPERYNASEILFQNVTKGRGAGLAVVGPSGQRTYAELCSDAGRWGNAFLSLGLKRGDRVLLCLDDTPAFPAAFFGAVRAGLVPLLTSLLSPPDLLRFYLTDSQATLAVVEAALSDKFSNAAFCDTPLNTLIVVNGHAKSGIPIKVIPADPDMAALSDRLVAADTHRDEMAFWMYSSGTTGRPKGVVHLQHDMPYTNHAYARSVLRFTSADICFSVPKMFFAYGFGNSITFPFSAGAVALLLPGQPKPDGIFAAIAKYRPTIFFGLPTLYNALTKSPDAAQADFSSIRLALSAAEALSPELFNAWKILTGLEIVEGLGSTEVLNNYLSNLPERKKSGAAGLRVPGYEIELKDRDGRTIIGSCDEGIMWVRGDSNAPLYWNRPDKTAETIHAGGWICTGDRFSRDAEGFYFFRGRADDLIKISGQWVYPMEVELCLSDHALVRECAVVAVQLPDRRMTLKAFVVMKDKVEDAELMTRSLQTYVKRKLLPHKYPRSIHFMDVLPKTGTGKIDRQALLQEGRDETQGAAPTGG